MPKPWDSRRLLPEFASEHATSEREKEELVELFSELAALPESDSLLLARGRDRLLSAVTASGERFSPFFDRLTSLFDLGADALGAIFERAANGDAWQAGPLPWVTLFHLDGGPAVAGLDTGLVRLKKSMPFPHHRHLGRERVVVLEGGYHDHEQRFYGPGDLHEMAEGTEHSLLMNGEQDTLLAVALAADIEVVGG